MTGVEYLDLPSSCSSFCKNVRKKASQKTRHFKPKIQKPVKKLVLTFLLPFVPHPSSLLRDRTNGQIGHLVEHFLVPVETGHGVDGRGGRHRFFGLVELEVADDVDAHLGLVAARRTGDGFGEDKLTGQQLDVLGAKLLLGQLGIVAGRADRGDGGVGRLMGALLADATPHEEVIAVAVAF